MDRKIGPSSRPRRNLRRPLGTSAFFHRRGLAVLAFLVAAFGAFLGTNEASAQPQVVQPGTPLSLGQFCTAIYGSSSGSPQCFDPAQGQTLFYSQCSTAGGSLYLGSTPYNPSTSPTTDPLVLLAGGSGLRCLFLNTNPPPTQSIYDLRATLSKALEDAARDSAEAAGAAPVEAADVANRDFLSAVYAIRHRWSESDITGLSQFAALDPRLPTTFAAAMGSSVPMAAPQPVGSIFKMGVFTRVFGEVGYRDGPGTLPALAALAPAVDPTLLPGNLFGDQRRRQSTFGVQLGLEAGVRRITSGDDGLIVGALGGYLQSHVTLRGLPTVIDLHGPTAGVFGTYFRGPFFTDLLFRADLLRMDYNDSFTAQGIEARNYNVVFNTGVKLNLGNSGFYVEPATGFEYIRTTFGAPIIGPDYFFSLRDGDTIKARVGARFGTTFTLNDVRIEPSVLVNGWDTVRQDNSTLFTSQILGSTLLQDRRDGLYAEVSPSVNFVTGDGWSGYTKAEFRLGDNLHSYGGGIGIRYTW